MVPMLESRLAKIYKKGGIISLTAKAYNGRVILAWLDETVYLASQDQQFANLDERTLMIAAALILGYHQQYCFNINHTIGFDALNISYHLI